MPTDDARSVADRVNHALLTVAYALLIVGVPLVCTDLAFDPFASPKLMALAVACACCCLAMSLHLVAARARVFGPAGLAVLLFVIVACLSLAGSETPGPSLWGSHRQQVGLLAVVASVIVGVAFSTEHRLPIDALHLWVLPVVSSTLLALVAIAAAVGIPLPAFLEPGADGTIAGTTGQPSALSALLSALSVYTIGQVGIRGHRWRPALMAAAALSLAAAVLTQWLPGLLGFAFGTNVLLVCWVATGRRARLGFAGAGTIVVAGLIVTSALRPDYVTPLGATGGWGWMGEVFSSAAQIAARSPLLGEGPASFQPGLVQLLTPEAVRAFFSQALPADAHNWLLELAATYGIPCALIALFLIARPLLVPSRIPRSAAPYATAALCLVVAGLLGPLSLSTLPVIALFIGVTWAVSGRRLITTDAPLSASIAPSTGGRLARWLARFVAAAMVAGAGVLLLLGSNFLRAELDTRHADLTSSLPKAEAAAERLQPPTAPAFWLAARIAAFEARIGADPQAATLVDELMARARAVDQRDPYTQLNWAISLQMLERHDDAIAQLEDALLLYPGWPLAIKGIAFSRMELGQPGEAVAILKPLTQTYPDDAAARELLDAAVAAEGGGD